MSFSYIVSFPVQICVQQAMDSVLSVAFCCIWAVSCKRFAMERIIAEGMIPRVSDFCYFFAHFGKSDRKKRGQ